MSIKNMTGLEVMQALVEGKIPPPSMAETIPGKGISAEKGKVLFEAKADERHLNPMGGVHGGFAATVLDTVTGCTVHTMLEAGVGYATIELNVKMLRPVPKNAPLLAEGRIISVTKSLGVSEGTLKDAQGRLLAHGTAMCMLFPAP